MKTPMECFADDLDALARVVFVVSQPEVIRAYDTTHGCDSAVCGLGLGLNTMIGLFAAKLRSEVTEEDRAKASVLEQNLQTAFGVVDGGSHD